MNRASLETMARRWRWHRALRHAGLSIAAACLTAGVLFPFHALAATVLGPATAVACALALRRHSLPITARTLAEHLNRQCPALEESATLWLRDSADLDVVERLQLRRLNHAWSQHAGPPPGQPPPRRLLPMLASLMAAAAFLIAVVVTSSVSPETQPAIRLRASRSPVPDAQAVLSATLEVHPPAYLGRPPRRLDTLSAEVEEGALVIWSFVTPPGVDGLELTSQGTNATIMAQTVGDRRFTLRLTLDHTLVYQVSVRRPDGSKITLPALHVLQVRSDAPPRLAWRSPTAARTSLPAGTPLPTMTIEVLAEDDHGVAEVRLWLTTARGSGEGMQFRDRSETLPDRSPPGSSNRLHATSLDLAALGLEPGDELYLQAVALDTRRPTPNETRTDTRRIVLAGPSPAASEPAIVLTGVRRLPQYFRSQRQLILDTEQLLAERPTLSEAQFRTRSENLGIDQKLLRLRYGQFLGEEFEPTSAGAPREAAAMEWATTLRNPSAQDADRTAAIGRAIEATHAHEPGPPPVPGTRPSTAQDVFADLAHNHDSPEAATFFDERLKASLRAVLAAMWQAEGHLRTVQPADALPAEHRALEGLKAIQQADRLSVGRVGSELPPLRLQERRLSGELEAIPASAPGTPMPRRPDPEGDALRQALATLTAAVPDRMPEPVAGQVEDLLWRAAQSQPQRYLAALEHWRARKTPLTPTALETLRLAVWSLLPATEPTPDRRRPVHPGLEQRYAEALEAWPSPTP